MYVPLAAILFDMILSAAETLCAQLNLIIRSISTFKLNTDLSNKMFQLDLVILVHGGKHFSLGSCTLPHRTASLSTLLLPYFLFAHHRSIYWKYRFRRDSAADTLKHRSKQKKTSFWIHHFISRPHPAQQVSLPLAHCHSPSLSPMAGGYCYLHRHLRKCLLDVCSDAPLFQQYWWCLFTQQSPLATSTLLCAHKHTHTRSSHASTLNLPYSHFLLVLFAYPSPLSPTSNPFAANGKANQN